MGEAGQDLHLVHAEDVASGQPVDPPAPSRSIDQVHVRTRPAFRFPEGILVLGVNNSLCRKRGLTIFGTGMHHDPLISSRQRAWVSWGHDWVILSLIIPN